MFIICREFSNPNWTLEQVIWTFCFSLILVVAILGNTIVLWIILGKVNQMGFFWKISLTSHI